MSIPAKGEEAKTFLWSFKQVTSRLSFQTRGPVTSMPPALGVYSTGFDHELHEAIKRDDKKTVRETLAAGANPNQTFGMAKVTSLHLAASVSAVESMEELLKASADLNATDSFGVHPLFVATMHGQPKSVK